MPCIAWYCRQICSLLASVPPWESSATKYLYVKLERILYFLSNQHQFHAERAVLSSVTRWESPSLTSSTLRESNSHAFNAERARFSPFQRWESAKSTGFPPWETNYNQILTGSPLRERIRRANQQYFYFERPNFSQSTPVLCWESPKQQHFYAERAKTTAFPLWESRIYHQINIISSLREKITFRYAQILAQQHDFFAEREYLPTNSHDFCAERGPTDQSTGLYLWEKPAGQLSRLQFWERSRKSL